MKTVLTYGTFDLLHYGHIELIRRAWEISQNGRLIVGVSSDEFNAMKGKSSHMPYGKRKELVGAIKYVDLVIEEDTWDQKKSDILKHDVDVLVMGDDWIGKFDTLKVLCEVVYLKRTPLISSTSIRSLLNDSR